MKIFFALALFLLANLQISHSQWKWQYPKPQGNEVRKLWAIDRNNVAISGGDAFFGRTTDGGNTWTISDPPFPQNYYVATNDMCFITQNNGWMAGSLEFASPIDSGFIVKTSDGGMHWSDISADSMPNPTSVCFVDEQNGWVGTGSYAVLKTSNGGASWIRVPIINQTVTSLEFLNSALGFACGSDGLLRTTDGGISWENVSSAPIIKVQMFDFILGFGAATSGLYKTTNGGNSWYLMHSGNFTDLNTQDGVSLSAIQSDGTLYYYSTPNNWTVRPSNIGMSISTSVLIDSSNIWCASGMQVKRTSDAGLSWTIVAGDTSFTLYDSKIGPNGNGYVIGDRGLLLKSSDYGETWTKNSVQSAPASCMALIDDLTLITAGPGGKIQKTTDGGLTWVSHNYAGAIGLYSIDMIDNLTGFIVGDAGAILKTTDGGITWHAKYSGLGSGLTKVQCSSPSAFYCGNFSNLLKSTDGGENWFSPSSYFSSEFCQVFDFLDSANGFAVTGYDSVVRTSDGGVTWSSLGSRTGLYSIHAMRFADQDNGWIISFAGGILNTTDGGRVWSRQQSRTENTLRNVSFLDNHNVWVVGDNSLLHTSNGGVTQVSEGKEKPVVGNFALLQNYPNPFNPVTTINYSLSQGEQIKLSIYNVLGQEVAVLINGYQTPGYKSVSFDAQAFSSGMYFYRITAGGFTDQKKLLLIK